MLRGQKNRFTGSKFQNILGSKKLGTRVKKALRNELQKKQSDEELTRWFDPLAFRSLTPNSIAVQFPHAFFADWFFKWHKTALEDAANVVFQGSTLCYEPQTAFASVQLGTVQQGSTASSAQNTAVLVPQAIHSDNAHNKKNAEKKTGTEKPASSTKTPFGAEYSFQNFIEGSGNSFPLAAVKKLAAGKAPEQKLLLLCGESGSGKTHILSAIANKLSENVPKKYIYFNTIHNLCTILQSAKNIEEAHAYFAQYQYILIDNFTHLLSFPTQHTAVLSLFEQLFTENTHIVLSVLSPFSRLSQSNEQNGEYALPRPLISRLEAGLMLKLNAPELSVLVRYAQEECAQNHIVLSKNGSFLLAQQYRDMRKIQGLLKRLLVYSDLHGKKISDDTLQKMMRSPVAVSSLVVDEQKIMELCAKYFGVTKEDLCGEKRLQNIVMARQIAMYFCRTFLAATYPEIGRIFGGKDHSTVMYGIKKIKENKVSNKVIHKAVTTLENLFLNKDS